MVDDDDEADEAERRREMYEQLCGTPEEREAEAREMEERAAKIKSDEVLQWARQRAEAREAETTRRRDVPYDGAGQPLPVVTRSYGAPVAAAPVDWDAWRKFILATVRKEFVTDKMLNKVVEQVGKTVSDWDVEVCRLTKEKREEALAPLRAEIAQLRAEVAELRGAALQRAQPMSVAEERRRAGALTRARQEIERLRAAGLRCDGDARDLDLGRVRGAFNEWQH